MQHIFVYMTAPNYATAKSIAKVIVEERLAAGVNIMGKVESLYWWSEGVQNTEEYVCLFKTTTVCFEALAKRIKELHPYQVPCIVALPIIFGYDSYLKWIEAETTTPYNIITA